MAYISEKTRQKVFAKCDERCGYCGYFLHYEDMCVDHIQPKHRGGSNDFENLLPSCRSCNSYKMTYTLEEFRKLMKTIHDRILNYAVCRIAARFGILWCKSWDDLFYFERINK